MRVGRHGYASNRGEPGLLETFIGKEAFLARYATHGGDLGTKLPEFLAALEHGEAAATRTADDWSRWLARGLLLIINVINSSLVIVGGPVASAFRFMAKRVEARLRSRLPRGFPVPRIEASRFGSEGVAYGGALLLHQRAFSINDRVPDNPKPIQPAPPTQRPFTQIPGEQSSRLSVSRVKSANVECKCSRSFSRLSRAYNRRFAGHPDILGRTCLDRSPPCSRYLGTARRPRGQPPPPNHSR